MGKSCKVNYCCDTRIEYVAGVVAEQQFIEDVLVDTDVIEKTTGGYKLKGKTLARGEEKFQKLLEEDDELRRKSLQQENRCK